MTESVVKAYSRNEFPAVAFFSGFTLCKNCFPNLKGARKASQTRRMVVTAKRRKKRRWVLMKRRFYVFGRGLKRNKVIARVPDIPLRRRLRSKSEYY